MPTTGCQYLVPSLLTVKMAFSFINIFSDSDYSNDVAPCMGTLGKVQSGLDFSQCSFGGTEQSSIHLLFILIELRSA